jgi:pentatricopeptide repeat protein
MGVIPNSRLIQALGHKGNLDCVHLLYNNGQLVLAQMNNEKHLQSYRWYSIENQMIVALAHAGGIEGAHVHRQRIIDQGSTPSSDAYDTLIQCVKETTDNSTNTLALWQESQARGVVVNIYLYNMIILKLSKAHKADLALDLFKQMKANRIRPSSVTFGAIITACCRVGDAQSTEVLFDEMKQQRNFKPRIPPYNMMIQFYTHIVQNRERVLYYFSELMRANVQPTVHTYKVSIVIHYSSTLRDVLM